ncbi:MAG: DEAD/DEAH box helicase family protein, partial [Bdellovibrionales bacterium]|nr:DEAD/DEAH box helicase family protein [Bdellovibrionales bacterium]
LTGELSGGQREQLYRDESIRLFIATPQTEVNDAGVDRKSNLEKTLQKLDLSRFSAIVFDECHHLRKNDAYARIVRFILGKSSGGPRLIGLSATPAETDEELDRIIDLFGGNSNVDCVRIDASAKPKRYLPKILSLPPVIIETGRPLEEAIRDVHGDLVSLLQEIAKASAAKRGHGSCNMQEIVKTAQSLVEDVSGIARVKGENVCSQFAKELRAELNADSSTRRMVGDRISLLGALGRYHRYLVDNGRALFLDRLGRDLASYRLGGYIPEEESVDGVASLISGEERDWLFRMLNNNYALSGYRVCFEESFRRAAVGTLYEAVLTSRDFYSFASIVAGWDPNKTDSFRSQNVAFNELFTLLRKDLSGKRYWYDHPITEQAIRIAKKHIEDGKPGRILVRAKVFERASYLAEVLSTRLKEYEQSASSVAGRKYMPHNLASERIQSFGEGDVIALVGTSFLAEGHHIPDADTLILTDPIVTGIEGIQFAGRVGRLGFGFVHALLTPGTLRAYFSGLARQRRSVKLVHRRFRV